MADGAPKTLFDFTAKSIRGEEVPLSTFRGKKAYLVVNVASACGLTARNYKELNELNAKYSSRGFLPLLFPCNQVSQVSATSL